MQPVLIRGNQSYRQSRKGQSQLTAATDVTVQSVSFICTVGAECNQSIRWGRVH